jgi:4-amino-4-deoxy-L-arabinose transferase-like glycosyltransferase
MIKSQTTNIVRCLLFIVPLFVVLGVIYSLVTPVLESSDEFDHYPYVQYVQMQHALPVMDPQDPGPWRQEAGQPPLYYILMAGLTSWIDTGDLAQVRWLNRHAFIGIPGQVGNKNLIIHQPEREALPWRGTVLAVHMIRLASVVLGAVTVWLVWRVAAQLCPSSSWVPLTAAALTAFNPMFLFVSAAVNNDVLAALLGSLALLLLISNRKPKASLLADFWLGLVLGLGALTKVSLVAMIPLALLVVASRIWREHSKAPLSRRLRLIISRSSLVILIVLAVAGWWYVRNYRLYGDLTGLEAFIAILGRRAEPLTWRGLLGEFGTFRRTYWGLFGGVNVPAPEPVYAFYDLLSLAGLVGLALRAWRRRRNGLGLWWVLALWAGLLFVALLRWVLIYYSFQGRLMFPGIAALSTFLALGLGEWFPPRRRPASGWAVSGVLLVLAAALPFVSILPAYAYPEPLALADVPAEARVEPVDVGGVARVVGWELEPRPEPFEGPQAVRGGENIEFVVYWEAASPDGRDYVSFANLLGRDHQPVGQINRHPACGMVPTSLWEPGQVWRDLYRVPVAENASSPSVLRVEVGLYDPETDETLGTVRVGEAKLAPPESAPEASHSLEVRLADGVALRGYDLSAGIAVPGEVITLTLHWEAWESPSGDYQVFVHLTGSEPEPAAQGDGPPLAGDYPTGMWAPGETIADPHPVALPPDLPPGQYRLVVGMYDLETLARLTRLDGSGDSIELPTPVEVR